MQNKKTILITGGAGYIGSVAAKEVAREGHDIVVVDNLSRGSSLLDFINSVATFYKVDLATEKDALEEVFKKHAIDAVMHFAAYKSVEESMEKPEKYEDNVRGTENLLHIMAGHKVPMFIFSSSAAVYRPPTTTDPLTEEDFLGPVNVYGATKLRCEEKIMDFCPAHNITYVNLRYFNVAGDGGLDYIEPRPENVFPLLMETLVGVREKFVIFGTDYPTKDGSCVRDYIHVTDLVRAHILALGLNESTALNLGTSKGYSVIELVAELEKLSGEKLNYRFGERRKGDPAVLVASSRKAKELMGWEPEKGIEEMMRSTLETYQKQHDRIPKT